MTRTSRIFKIITLTLLLFFNLKAIVIGSDDWYIYQTYIKLWICYKALENYDLALKNLQKGKELTKKSTSDPETKQKWFTITDLFLTDIEH